MYRRDIAFAMLSALMILLGMQRPVLSLAACLMLSAVIIGCEEYGMLLLFFLLPFGSVFKLSPTGTSLFTVLEFLYILASFVRKKFRLSAGDIVTFFFALVMIAAEIMSDAVSVTSTLKVLVNLLLLERFMELGERIRTERIYRWFTAGVIASSCAALLDSVFPIQRFVTVTMMAYSSKTESISRFTGLVGDPNYYAVNIIVCICLAIVLYKKRKADTVGTVITIGVLAIFAGMTGSKSALLMLCVVMLLFVASCLQGKRYVAFSASCIAIYLLGLAVLDGRIELFDGVLQRLSQSTQNINALTTGRFGVWLSFLHYFRDNPQKLFLGKGVGVYLLYGRAPHNTYIDLIYQLGIVGTALYVYIVGLFVRKFRKVFRRNFLNYSVLGCSLVMFFFLSQLQRYDLPFLLGLAFFVWNESNEYKGEEAA